MIESEEKRAKRLARKKAYREANRERINADKLKHYHENQAYFNAKAKEWQKANSEKVIQQRKIYNASPEVKLKNKLYKSSQKYKESVKNYRENNKEKIKEAATKYRNKPEAKEKSNQRTINRRKNEPLFKFKGNVRCLIKNSLKSKWYRKNSKTVDILGCSIEQFKLYIEAKFEWWMNWDNYGKFNGEPMYGWDLDHIIPISSADSYETCILLNHYCNFQPLDSRINRFIKKDNPNFY